MARYLKKKKKSVPALPIVAVVVLVLLAALAVFVLPRLLYRISGDSGETLPPQTELPPQTTAPETTEPPIPSVSFPLPVDDGKLEIDSLFPFSGINPDCGNQEGTQIAAIVLKNVSGEYLSQASASLTLLDGTVLNFTVSELPAGESAMAFSTENADLPSDAVCIGAECTASYDPAAVTMSDQVTASVDGIHITLTNVSGQTLPQIVVYCRSPLGEDYFGGMAYSYTITNLPAGESTSLDATDCVMGMAEVVRFAVDE